MCKDNESDNNYSEYERNQHEHDGNDTHDSDEPTFPDLLIVQESFDSRNIIDRLKKRK